MILTLPAVTVVVAALLALTPGDSSKPSRAATDATLAKHISTPAPGEAALRARIDPETGKVDVSTIPSHAQSTLKLDPETTQALRRDTEGLKEVHHPNGAVSVNLQGRFQDAMVAHIDKNGRVVICTEKDKDATAVLQGRQLTAPTPDPAPEVQ